MKLPIFVLCLTSASLALADDHFARAQELYQGGPSKAPEILEELNLELREHPDNIQAYVLKAITEMGTDQLDQALATLAEADKHRGAKIYRFIPFFRAKCLFLKGDFEKAEKVLEPYSAFWMANKDDQAKYDELMNAIQSGLKAAKQ